MSLDYDHNASRESLLLSKQWRLDSGKEPKAFGSTATRFELDELSPTPGIGSYSIDREDSMIRRTPSVSKRGSYSSKSLRLTPHPNNRVPGPGQYNLPDLGHLEPWERRPSTAFVASGKGRVPFPDPNPYPGPADYRINFNPGESPVLRNKISATFASKSGRDSFFDVLSPAPPASKYWAQDSSLSANHDVAWHKSTFTRMQQIGYDNKVPGCHRYFDDRLSYEKDTSLRSCGNYRGKLLGKQNERPKEAIHTFGADKDRFKDSVYGRLDLKALIPGPGVYDDIHRYAKERAQSARITTAVSPTRLKSLQSDGSVQLESRNSTKDPVHNFGGDPDRFNKHTFYGRLDHKAEIPGPGCYDDIFKSTKDRIASPNASSIQLWSPTNSPGVRASSKGGSRQQSRGSPPFSSGRYTSGSSRKSNGPRMHSDYY